MGGTITGLEGTPAGAALASVLALVSALAHAVFGALQKGRHDPWLSRGAIDGFIFLFSLPVALFLVPAPRGAEWLVLAGALPIHFAYKLGVAMSYARGAYTVVYPVVRGTGPLFAVIGAWALFGEVFTAVQWLGVAVLLAGIYGLAAYNLAHVRLMRETLVAALAYAVGTGALVAFYTTYDAFGIRLTPDPFTFLAWFFLITAVDFPVLALLRWRSLAYPPAARPLMLRGAAGALVAFVSFGAVMLATRLDKVGEAAVLRETSAVFAALIGWAVLKEPVGPRRAMLMGLIAAGAVIVEWGG